MKLRSLMVALFSLSLTTGAFATNLPANQNDTCSNSPGHWSGIFLLKSETDCKNHNGCSHHLAANVTGQGSEMYQLELIPSMGSPITVPVQCTNGKITSQVLPDANISIKCPAGGACVVNYEDQRFYIRIEKTDA